MDELYDINEFDVSSIDGIPDDSITEKDRLDAAKKILLGIAILYVLTLAAYLFKPEQGDRLIDIASTTFPSFVTLILAQYFKQKT